MLLGINNVGHIFLILFCRRDLYRRCRLLRYCLLLLFGILSKEEFRMKWINEDAETAAKAIKENGSEPPISDG